MDAQRQLTYQECDALLATRLRPERYAHSVGVAETSAVLAARFGVDVPQARLAGLLHDCAREFPSEQVLSQCLLRGMAPLPIERAMPFLLHAPLGAHIARERYGVSDAAVLRAIALHTVGGENMAALDKIIYFADMVEPAREYPEVERLRGLARTAPLDEMFLAGLDESIVFVVRKGHMLHPQTIAARNEILLAATAHG